MRGIFTAALAVFLLCCGTAAALPAQGARALREAHGIQFRPPNGLRPRALSDVRCAYRSSLDRCPARAGSLCWWTAFSDFLSLMLSRWARVPAAARLTLSRSSCGEAHLPLAF